MCSSEESFSSRFFLGSLGPLVSRRVLPKMLLILLLLGDGIKLEGRIKPAVGLDPLPQFTQVLLWSLSHNLECQLLVWSCGRGLFYLPYSYNLYV